MCRTCTVRRTASIMTIVPTAVLVDQCQHFDHVTRHTYGDTADQVQQATAEILLRRLALMELLRRQRANGTFDEPPPMLVMLLLDDAPTPTLSPFSPPFDPTLN